MSPEGGFGIGEGIGEIEQPRFKDKSEPGERLTRQKGEIEVLQREALSLLGRESFTKALVDYGKKLRNEYGENWDEPVFVRVLFGEKTGDRFIHQSDNKQKTVTDFEGEFSALNFIRSLAGSAEMRKEGVKREGATGVEGFSRNVRIPTNERQLYPGDGDLRVSLEDVSWCKSCGNFLLGGKNVFGEECPNCKAPLDRSAYGETLKEGGFGRYEKTRFPNPDSRNESDLSTTERPKTFFPQRVWRDGEFVDVWVKVNA